MQRRQLNLSLELELLDGDLHGRCHDGNGRDHRFSGWLGLIGAIDSLVSDQGEKSVLISQSSRFAELRSRIDGQVLLAGDDAWDASRQTFNLTHDQQPAPSSASRAPRTWPRPCATPPSTACASLRSPQDTTPARSRVSRTRCSYGPTTSRRSASTWPRAAPGWALASAGPPWPTPPPRPGWPRSRAPLATSASRATRSAAEWAGSRGSTVSRRTP